MTMYLPTPYDDELLYSVIARHCTHLNLRVHHLACTLFRKKFIKLRADLPCSLREVSEQTFPAWQKKPEDILYELTLFKYFEPFLPLNIRSKKTKSLLYGIERHPIGVKSYRVENQKFLRYCIKCREHDIEDLGETYWHRTHQLPGVLFCPEHELPLITTSAPMQPNKTVCHDATLITAEQPESLPSILDHTERMLALKIARRSQEILSRKECKWSGDNFGSLYRNAAIERGFYSLPGIFSYRKFEEEFLKYYGMSLITKLGVKIPMGRTSWIQYIFYNNERQPVHPLEHILVQIFLEHMPVVATSQPYGTGPWRCPNPYATHEDEFPIKKTAIRTATDSTVHASVHCSCGFRFTFTETHRDDPHLPIIKDVWAYGPTWQTEAKRLLGQGLGPMDVANKMALSMPTLRNLLKQEITEHSNLDKRIREARAVWLRLLDRTPNRSVATARRMDYGTYQYLRKHDRQWVLAQTERRRRKLDWSVRDAEWSCLLGEAAEKIRSSIPPRRAAKTVIVKEAGLNLRVLAELERLSKCREIINSYSESPEAFRERQRLRH